MPTTQWFLDQMILSKTKQDLGSQIIQHGIGLSDTWTGLAFQKEPEDIVGKITWWAGVISQLIVSTITFPAALASFLLEESAQSGGMGAYMLYTAKAWTPLSSYIKVYQSSLTGFSNAAANLALVNPIAGGAVIIYMEQAKLSSYAMEEAMLAALRKDARNLGVPNYMQYSASELICFIEIAESEKSAKAIQEAQEYGTLACLLYTSPSPRD